MEDLTVIFRVHVKLDANMSYAHGNSTSHMMAWILSPSVYHKIRIVARQWLKETEIVVRFQEVVSSPRRPYQQ